MRWEELLANEFEEAVHATSVCIVAPGSIEKQGEHLPVGQNYLGGHHVACLAAEKEPAVVFPALYLGMVQDTRMHPGAIGLDWSLLHEFAEDVISEISRNGFRKIIVYPAHNPTARTIWGYLVQYALYRRQPYCLYLMQKRLTPERDKIWKETVASSLHGPGCEYETSRALAQHPEFVRTNRIPAQDTAARKPDSGLPQNALNLFGYGRFPDGRSEAPRAATAEKGEILTGLLVDTLTEYIAAVKADQVVPALTEEFYDRLATVGAPSLEPAPVA